VLVGAFGLGWSAFTTAESERDERAAPANPHGPSARECRLCHSADQWRPARIDRRFDHERLGFMLTGAHASTPCLSCHVSLDFREGEAKCASCHEDVHLGELGTDCARCHSERSFDDRGDMMRMHALTRFPLSAGHAGVDCESCHPGAAQGRLRFRGIETECRACHEEDYRSAGDPDHEGSGFPLACEACHTTATWADASFDHGGSRFPLTGAHVAANCQSCHITGTYGGLAADCASCHQADFDATTDPNHVVAAFPLTCETCHGTVTWDDAILDHEAFFPIDSGRHREEWTACADCHSNPTSYGDFTCLVCHPHSDRIKTDQDHQGEDGYAYESRACFECHPTGDE
jgi:Zn finger protein HypA/HybF involved in hydrogenase expression